MDRPRREYEERHSQSDSIPVVGGPTIYVTELKHPETNEKSTGCGWDRKEANSDAERRLREKDDSCGGYNAGKS